MTFEKHKFHVYYKHPNKAKKEPTMAIKEIIVDRELCIGAASCVAVAPEVYELDSENKAIVKKYEGVSDQTILDSAKSCPTNAIILKDDTGKKVWPEN